MAVLKKKSGKELEEQHFTWAMIFSYMYIFGTAAAVLISLGSMIFLLIHPDVPEVRDAGNEFQIYVLLGDIPLGFDKEILPFADIADVDQRFAMTYLALNLAVCGLPLLFIAWKGYRILHIMESSWSPFVPEIAAHICWIGRAALFIGLFSKFIIQAGMSAVIYHMFYFCNPFEMPWILAGLILLLVSDIFRKGCILQKEADETL